MQPWQSSTGANEGFFPLYDIESRDANINPRRRRTTGACAWKQTIKAPPERIILYCMRNRNRIESIGSVLQRLQVATGMEGCYIQRPATSEQATLRNEDRGINIARSLTHQR